ncbi:MAG: M16 family metallopeptidase, partial [Fimbriimonadales bacterium]
HAETRQRLERALHQIAQGEARPVLERARTVALLRHTAAMRHPSERARWYGLCTTLGLTLSPEEYAARLQSVPIEKVEAFARATVESVSSDALLSGGVDAMNGGGQDTHRLGETLTQPTKALASTRTPRESSAAIARRTAVRQRLSNGLRVIALSAPDAESVLIQVAIAHPHAENAAVGELTARMLFGETRNETPYTLAMRIARSGGSLRIEWTPAGALITAFAQPDSVVNVLALLKESLFRAEFTEPRLESARRQALYDRRYYEGVQGWRLTARLLNAYADEHMLNQVALRDIRAYYQAHYRPENTCLVIAGDFPTNRLVEFAHRLFGHEWETLSAPKPQEQAIRTEMRIGTVATPQGQTYTGYVWASSVASAKDYYALRAFQVILAEGKQARLFRATRTQRGVGYAVQMEIALTRGGALGAGWVQTGSAPVPPDVLQAVLSEALHPEEWRRAQALLRGEWERLRMHLPAFTASLAWAELSGLGYEALWNAPDEIHALTHERIEALRNQLIRSRR